MALRDITAEDLGWIHALNRAHEAETSPLSPSGLQDLVARAKYARAIGDQAGFLIGFDQNSEYASPNFIWFRSALPEFLYVDRIIVNSKQQGRGLARKLYDDFFDFARHHGHKQIACEVHIVPPNPVSDAFHANLGFSEIGQATLSDRGKTVRYLCKAISTG